MHPQTTEESELCSEAIFGNSGVKKSCNFWQLLLTIVAKYGNLYELPLGVLLIMKMNSRVSKQLKSQLFGDFEKFNMPHLMLSYPPCTHTTFANADTVPNLGPQWVYNCIVTHYRSLIPKEIFFLH